MEKESTYILYVPDMAKLMRKSEAAIRAAVFRGSESIPKPFKLGQKLAWVEADALKFIEEKRKGTEK